MVQELELYTSNPLQALVVPAACADPTTGARTNDKATNTAAINLELIRNIFDPSPKA
jgi:hypothetical protein